MLYYFYLRKGVVYIPTPGMVEKGFYRDIEPVTVVPVSNTGALRQALRDTIARGNPIVPRLPRAQWPPPVTLKHAGVKTWGAFERGMSYWAIKEDNGVFRIVGHWKNDTKLWVEDPDKIETFAPGTTADEVIDRMITVLQTTGTRKSLN